MYSCELAHLSDGALLRGLAALVNQDRATTAALLAHLAEVDERRLFLPAAYPSMYAYCVGELRFSEDAASKRIQAARVARRFPAIFPALADGRLHLGAVVLLAPHLTVENARELIETAAHKTKSEIERLLAERFPRTELLPWVQILAAPGAPTPTSNESDGESTVKDLQHAPGHVGTCAPPSSGRVGPGAASAPGRMEASAPRPKLAPIGPQHFALQLTIGQSAYDKLQYAQALLGHAVPSGDLAVVIERALDALVCRLEKQKFAATSRPRPTTRRSSAHPRYVPATVKRAVWERDGGRCTFLSEHGRRCPARTRLEFDHVEPVARGGRATLAGLRLLCRAHNQYAAERVFGAAFMGHKRNESRRAGAARDVTPWLRGLGFRADEARRAAAACAAIPDASLEERVRFALLQLMPPHRRIEYHPATVT
ncbi:MAG: hypothetical protein HY076_00200 [Candidatus Eisenbacteria bacterium]|uniref:HNH nuclease domain-containing protein n=1 Tax=Eiseniibacteriota bacterium TaxID=2212470 RepID=A0A9D6L8M6_UNCEI|nr:hypothetical protein [Candidatus Eisenbacteria bacterium]